MSGLDFIEYCDFRRRKGTPKNRLEQDPRHVLYFARNHQEDHRGGPTAVGYLKIGRAMYANTLQRGRNQGGGDFRLYAEVLLSSEDETRRIEEVAALVCMNRHHHSSIGQNELYDIGDEELRDTIDKICDAAAKIHSIRSLEINTWFGCADIEPPLVKITPYEELFEA